MTMSILQVEIAIQGEGDERAVRDAAITELRALLTHAVYLLDVAPVEGEHLRDTHGRVTRRRPWDGRSYDDRQLHR